MRVYNTAMPPRIAVVAEPPAEHLLERAVELAGLLGLPLLDVRDDASQYDLLMTVTQDRLQLGEPGGPTIGADFLSGPLGRRVRSAAHGSASLRRAVGFKRPPWLVVDATAGLGRDAFVLAAAGCQVIAIERSPIIAALVADGLARARIADPVASAAAERVVLVVADARQWLARHVQPDAIYMDPMFPPREKSALVKKEMRICRLVAGPDCDAGELLAIARQAARSRVAVKRPAHAGELAPPAFTLPGRTVRYDVYLPARVHAVGQAGESSSVNK